MDMKGDFTYHFYSSTVSAWQAMYQDALGATKSIYWEIYIFIDDVSGNRFIDLLCEKAKQGVDVKIIIDAFGSYNLSNLSINRLRSCGGEVLLFNKLNLQLNLRQWWSRIWMRTHCKILIIDEEDIFIGGVNVQNYMQEWDDVQLRLSGKVTRPLLRYFARKYISAGGKRKNVKHLLHPKLINKVGELKEKIKFLINAPHKYYDRSPIRKFYRTALSAAKESFTLLTPYYAPDRKFLELIYKASKRGVKVNIILPFKNDIKLMNYMARAFYGLSKKAGATFYFLKKMNHGKALTVDKKLGMVGSANLTKRSYFMNHEANVVFQEENMVEELNHLLDDWKNKADPNLEKDFKDRSIVRRVKNWWAYRFKDHV